MRPTIFSCNFSIVPRDRNVAIALRNSFASAGLNLAASMAIFIACS